MTTGLGAIIFSLFVFFVLQTQAVFDYFDGRTVVVNPVPLEWSEAVYQCAEMNGTLLSITNAATMFDAGIEGRWIIWVGLKTNGTSGVWQSGEQVTWTNWFSSRPTEDKDKCLSIETPDPYYWELRNCSTKLPSLCEIRTGKQCEFDVQTHSSLIGLSNSLATNFDLASCRNACILSTDFECQSFEFNAIRGFCQLSDTNRWMHQGKFTFNDPEWNYYHMDCYDSDFNQSWIPNGQDQTSTTPVPMTTAPTEICINVEDLIPTENATREIESAIQELQDLGTKYKDKRRSMTKESVKDDRPSATYVGSVAMIIMSSFIGVIVILDVLTMGRHCCKHKKKEGAAKTIAQPTIQLKTLAQGRSIMAERGKLISAHSASNNNGAAVGNRRAATPVEIEDVHVIIQTPSVSTIGDESQSDSATLQICRVNSDNAYKFPYRLASESIIRGRPHTLPSKESNSYINSAYVNTSPVLSPFHRSQSERNTTSLWRSSQSLELTPPGRSARSTSDPFTCRKMSGSPYTMWPYSNRNRITIKYDHAGTSAEKYILAYGNDFRTEDSMETFKH